jgi:hypothetical protein
MIKEIARDISKVMAGKPVAGRGGQDKILLGKISRPVSELRTSQTDQNARL